MSENSLVPRKISIPVPYKRLSKDSFQTVVNYEKIDSSHYSFTYSFNDSVDFRMDESDQSADNTEFIEAEFEESVPESEKAYYAVAAASGLLTGLISMLHLTEAQLNAIDDFKEKDWKPIIIRIAYFVGYKKGDYKGAAKYLLNRAVRTIEKSKKVNETLTILSEHPSFAGLLFSVITQFSGKSISLSETGKINRHRLPDYYTIGETNAEKIVCAVLYWFFALAADEAFSKRRVLDESGIPSELLKRIKEFANIPFMKNIPSNYSDAEKLFSQWLKKVIDGAELQSESDEQDNEHNLLFGLMGIALNLVEDSFPVLINECIVHSLYILLRICSVAKERKIASFDDLKEIPVADVLPEKGRLLSKMCLISSASFVAVNVSGATLKAIRGKKKGNSGFANTFFTELNLAGIGCFLFACVADSKYWGEDLHILLHRKGKVNEAKTSSDNEEHHDGDAFNPLYLDAIQARILYCLENISVQYDIAHTKKTEASKKKSLWLNKWKNDILQGFEVPSEIGEKYFIEDEDLLYNGIYQLSQDRNNWGWLYLVAQELALFDPYFPLGCTEDKSFKGLKKESDYVSDQFIRRQTVVSQSEIESIGKTYTRYKGIVSGSTKNKIIGLGVTAAAAVATGGVALTFAPAIAAAIAGEAVVGLHGAALTSASLAFVGGGSLAAGGLGMAGGTAIITGGGALIGLAGSGSVSATTMLLHASNEYWIRQCAKLLTYCNCILCDYLKDKDSVEGVLHQIETALARVEREIESVKSEENELDKEILSKAEEFFKYIKRCEKELQKLIKE